MGAYLTNFLFVMEDFLTYFLFVNIGVMGAFLTHFLFVNILGSWGPF
ncbi:hypothetical protein T07_13088 [Trichinella nelsoni]|uniref:Uncharacterized protein n=1 Tax=Trichinella nelsoni TaxID=6336 RepID=A0A0V0RCX9_9BILA|nr:hypothetical protein T07_13088 [Trichinella nelsoni]